LGGSKDCGIDCGARRAVFGKQRGDIDLGN